MNVLLINTASNKTIRVGIRIDGKEKIIEQNISVQKAQVVLPLIEKLLKMHAMTLSDINEIEVNTGPGSFTGLRVGIAVANALAFLLGIPVNKKPVGEFVEPKYE